MRRGLRLALLGLVSVGVLALSSVAQGDGTAHQVVVPGGGGFAHVTVDGTWMGFTPGPDGVSPRNIDFAAAADGSVVFLAKDSNAGYETGSVWLAKPDGSSVHLDDSTWDFSPSISYDGSKVVFARFDPTSFSADIYSVNADGSDRQLVVPGGGINYLRVPVISPDGSSIAYWCGPAVNGDTTATGCGPLTDGSYRYAGAMRVNIDGSHPRMIVIGGGNALEPVGPTRLSWSPDSQWIAMDGSLTVDLGGGVSTAQRQIFEYRTDASDLFNNADPMRQITHESDPYGPAFAQFSPDGSQILYMEWVDDDGDEGNFIYMAGVDGTGRHELPIRYGAFIPTATPVAPPPLVDMTHIKVPPVTDIYVEQATDTLEDVNLTVGSVTNIYSEQPTGQVIGQSPRAGAIAHRTQKTGPAVNLVVSKGAPPPQRLTVLRSGVGSGTVSAQPSGILCGSVCSHLFKYGVKVVLTATAPVGSKFVGWTGACSGTGLCTVTMNQARKVTATFIHASATLKVSKAGGGGGKVVSSTLVINCGTTCSWIYGYGATVALTALPWPGSKFAGWSGACTGTGVCKVTMKAAASVTATFVKLP